MDENEFVEFEGRSYIDPTLSRNEQLSFVDTLRETQAKNTAQINADTYALGSQLPSNLGGLSGAEETFAARYQRPQTEATVADLRTAAQQSALNQALSNLQNAYKKRYNDAILNYQRRAATPTTNPSNDPDETPDTNGGNEEGVRLDPTASALYKSMQSGLQGTEAAINEISSMQNQEAKRASVPFLFYDPITKQMQTGIVYRNTQGVTTGMKMYGKEYNQSDAVAKLQQLAQSGAISDVSGNKYSPEDFYVQGISITTNNMLNPQYNRAGQ